MSTINALESRIGGYQSQAADLQKSVYQKSIEADQLRKKAADKPDISLQDALISSVIQVLPGLLGYAASGKGGAAIGLQAGLGGGQIYNKLVDDDLTTQQKQYAIDAESASKEAQLAEAERKRLEGKGDSLEDKLLMSNLKEEQIRGRPSKTADALGGLYGTISQFLANKEGSSSPVEDTDPQATPATAATGEVSSEMDASIAKTIVDLADTEQGAFLTNTKQGKDLLLMANSRLGIDQKVQGLKIGEQKIIQSQADTEKAKKEGALLEEEFTSKDRYRKIVEEGQPLPFSGLKLVAGERAFKGGTKESEAKIDELSALANQADISFKQILDISDILDNVGPGGRILGQQDAGEISRRLSDTLALFYALAEPGNKSPNEAAFKRAQKNVESLQLSSIFSNLGEQASAISFGGIPSFKEKLKNLTTDVLTRFEGAAKSQYGYDIKVDVDSMQNDYQRANNEGRVEIGSAADGKRYKVTYDANNNPISVEEVQ